MSAAPVPDPLVRYGLVALLAFAPLVDGGTTYVPATVIRLGALGLAVAWLWRALDSDGRWRRPTPIDLPVFLFMMVAAISTWTSDYSVQSLQAFLGLASGVLVLAVAAEVVRERSGPEWLSGAVVFGGVAQALLALAQFAWGTVPRATGTFFNPNHLAMALSMTGALLLAAQPASRSLKVGVWITIAAVGAALIITGSRGGILAALVGWGLVGWYRWRGRAIAVAATIVLGLAVVPNPLADRWRNVHAQDPFAYTRLRIWQSAIERAVDHPLGVGLNLFRQSSQRYAFPIEGEVARYGRRAESAHNDYLQILAELGPLGLALALWGVAVLAASGRRALHETRFEESRPLRLGAAGTLTALAAQALVDSPLHVPGVLLPAAALAGILVAGPSAAAPPAVPVVFGPVLRRPPRLVAVALGCVAAFGVARHGLAYLAAQRAEAVRATAGPIAEVPWLERAARLVPESAAYPDALAGVALAAWKASGDPKHAVAAEQAMLRAIALDPLNARRRVRLAFVYREIVPADPALRRKALERARALYEEAERLDPYEAAYPFALAEMLAQLGDEGSALTALERAIGLEPRFLPARLMFARARAARGEVAAAKAEYAAIEATLDAYRDGQARGPYAAEFLGVDRAVVRREAAALKETAS